MNLVPSDRFYALFEQMVEEMNNIENFDRDRFIAVLTQLSELFRISKGVTEFYTNENKEKIGEGEIIIDYDNGKGGPAIIYHRIVTKSQAVIKGTIYRTEDEEPLSECDLKRLDLIVLQLLSFVARNRLASAIEALGFYDDFGYKNRRAFFRQVENLYGQNKLNGNYSALMMNMRHFSIINQDIGRSNGDIVLRNFYKLLSAIADTDGIVSRLGGDSFIALLRNELVEHITSILRGVPIYYDRENEKRVLVSASAGIYHIPEDFTFENASDIMDKILSNAEFGAQHRSADYKTQLQELVQKKSGQHISYELSDERGPDHNKVFTFRVYINGVAAGEGSGRTKKEAEQMAARGALEALGE